MFVSKTNFLLQIVGTNSHFTITILMNFLTIVRKPFLKGLGQEKKVKRKEKIWVEKKEKSFKKGEIRSLSIPSQKIGIIVKNMRISIY